MRRCCQLPVHHNFCVRERDGEERRGEREGREKRGKREREREGGEREREERGGGGGGGREREGRESVRESDGEWLYKCTYYMCVTNERATEHACVSRLAHSIPLQT